MDKEQEQYVQEKINYWFNNVDLLHQAFTKNSFARENNCESNENLELMGDSILYMYVTKYLTNRFGYLKSEYDDLDEYCMENNYDQADLTNIRQRLIERDYLAARIDKMGIKDYLYLSKGDAKKHEENTTKVKCDLFEAILGAIAIDCDWDQEALQNSVEFMLDIDKYLQQNLDSKDNYMMLLQQWNQKEYGIPPKYDLARNSDGTLTAYVVIETSNGKYEFSGDGKNATQAKTEAAREAYEYLEENDELYTIMDEITEKITEDNALSKLYELSDKGYFSRPIFNQSDEQVYDNDGAPVWECTCYVESENLEKTAISSSKKGAKKYSAYLVLIDILGFENEYE